MKISPEQVAKIATLARLTLDDDKLAVFAGQFDGILTHMDQLAQVDTEGVEPLFNTVETPARMREDVAISTTQPGDVLSNAPESDGTYFIVPKIV